MSAKFAKSQAREISWDQGISLRRASSRGREEYVSLGQFLVFWDFACPAGGQAGKQRYDLRFEPVKVLGPPDIVPVILETPTNRGQGLI
jgi:hypothetical protein